MMKRQAIAMAILDGAVLLSYVLPLGYVAVNLFEAAGDCNPQDRRNYINIGLILTVCILALLTAGGRALAGLFRNELRKKRQTFFGVICCLITVAGDVVMHEQRLAGPVKAAFFYYNFIAVMIMTTSVLASLLWGKDFSSNLE